MTASLLPNAKQQFFDTNGRPLAGGSVYFYIPNTSTFKTTWQDAGKTILNTNPVVLDANGQAIIYGDGQYRQVVYDVHGNLIWDRLTDSYALNSEFQSFVTTIEGPTGASLIGFLQAGTGAVTRSIQDKDRDIVSVKDFGAKGDGVTDDKAAIQAALNSFSAVGGEVILPKGTYICSGPLVIPKNMVLRGAGKLSSTLRFTNTGDGLQSTWPINSSTAANISVRDLGIVNTNAANTGGGFVDVGGTYIDLDRLYITGFMYQVIFDQTEIASLMRSTIEQTATSKCGVWLVNGPDHTAGASVGYTNRITISNMQFNSAVGAGPNIVDDGGGSHSFLEINYNAGTRGIRAAGVANLLIKGGESEGHSDLSILLTDTTAGIGQLGVASTYIGPCTSIDIEDIDMVDIVPTHIVIDDAQGGCIQKMRFGQATSQNILFNNGAACKAAAVKIGLNSKLITGSFRQAAPYIGGFSAPRRANIIEQTGDTYSVNPISAGTVTVTPASMEGLGVNTRAFCINTDGTNGEQIFITAVTSTTFTATFASAKTAGFIIYGITPQTQEENSYVPSLFGSTTAGNNTYTNRQGYYSRRGAQVFFTVAVAGTTDAAMAGQLHITLPFTPAGTSGAYCGSCTILAVGWTLANYTQIVGAIVGGTSDVSVMATGSGQVLAALSASNLGGTFNFLVSGSYITSSL